MLPFIHTNCVVRDVKFLVNNYNYEYTASKIHKLC